MIKRSGVEVMNARTKNVSIAKETIQICKDKKYTSLNGNVVDISVSLDAAIKGTKYYPENVPYIIEDIVMVPTIEVVNETTAQAAVRLAGLGKTNLVALNFASARNQGGGFLAGAIAQEEDLCRCSGLYPCLKSKPLFYNANILCDDCYYTDGIIYSPNVPFFRNEFNLFIENPFTLSIVTSPAPNLNAAKDVDKNHVAEVLASRMTKILSAAHENGHRNIILGAWGCGAFGNDPEMVSKAFMLALSKVPYFEHVTFAVYDIREPFIIYETFKEVFCS